jgi:hypothetical protein
VIVRLGRDSIREKTKGKKEGSKRRRGRKEGSKRMRKDFIV